jgi:DNA-binding response OmpR family regulator
LNSEGELLVGQKSPHRIIVVEDNPADTLLLRHALDQQPEAYALQVLQDGESALKYVRDHCAQGRPEPCLIILDLHLPKYDGATVLRAIRSHPELASVRVVVLTTMGSPAEKEEVLALGVELYRIKPTNWDEMVELGQQLIDICNTHLKASVQQA